VKNLHIFLDVKNLLVHYSQVYCECADFKMFRIYSLMCQNFKPNKKVRRTIVIRQHIQFIGSVTNKRYEVSIDPSD